LRLTADQVFIASAEAGENDGFLAMDEMTAIQLGGNLYRK
jgi:hypothetical protein